MNTVLISGANRGIGLEFCKQYAALGWSVLACCRNPQQADQLNRLARQGANVHVYALDVLDREAIDRLSEQLSDRAIDVLLANAGVYGGHSQNLGGLDYSLWLTTLEINVLGAVKLVEAFLPQLRRGTRPVIAALSSQMGSIADNGSGGSILYRSSKAALNAAMKRALLHKPTESP